MLKSTVELSHCLKIVRERIRIIEDVKSSQHQVSLLNCISGHNFSYINFLSFCDEARAKCTPR